MDRPACDGRILISSDKRRVCENTTEYGQMGFSRCTLCQILVARKGNKYFVCEENVNGHRVRKWMGVMPDIDGKFLVSFLFSSNCCFVGVQIG